MYRVQCIVRVVNHLGRYRKCGHISTTIQHFQDFILEIKQSDNVNDVLENCFEKEQLRFMHSVKKVQCWCG